MARGAGGAFSQIWLPRSPSTIQSVGRWWVPSPGAESSVEEVPVPARAVHGDDRPAPGRPAHLQPGAARRPLPLPPVARAAVLRRRLEPVRRARVPEDRPARLL